MAGHSPQGRKHGSSHGIDPAGLFPGVLLALSLAFVAAFPLAGFARSGGRVASASADGLTEEVLR